jgi:hypothetical protein
MRSIAFLTHASFFTAGGSGRFGGMNDQWGSYSAPSLRPTASESPSAPASASSWRPAGASPRLDRRKRRGRGSGGVGIPGREGPELDCGVAAGRAGGPPCGKRCRLHGRRSRSRPGSAERPCCRRGAAAAAGADSSARAGETSVEQAETGDGRTTKWWNRGIVSLPVEALGPRTTALGPPETTNYSTEGSPANVEAGAQALAHQRLDARPAA